MYRPAKQIAVFALAVLVVASAACKRDASTGAAKGDTSVAASVNGKNIMLSEVERIIGQQAQGQQAQMSPLELAAARLQVLDNLIQEQVLLQRAEKDKLLPSDDEITTAINTQKSQFTQEEWDKLLKDRSTTEQGLREEARKALAIKKLQERTIGKAGSASEQEITDFYNNNKERFVNSRGVFLSGVVVDPADNGLQDDARNDMEATAKINRLYTQLKSGADFATVARASSEDQSNVRAGDMGFANEDELKRNGFPPSLISELFGPMQIGSFSSPVQFNGRWYIFKLTNRQLQNENLTLESPGVRDQIKDALLKQRQALLNAALVATAMNEAKIENHLAQSMLNDPQNSLNSLRPSGGAKPAATATPATGATTPATGSSSPAAATPAPAATAAASPAASPQR